MSFFDAEKMQSIQTANLELLQQMNGKMFEGIEHRAELQLKALRALSEDQFEACRQLLNTRDPQSLFQLQGAFVQPMSQAERLLEFNRKIYDLLSSTQAEVAKLGEKQVAVGAKQVQEALETISSNASGQRRAGGRRAEVGDRKRRQRAGKREKVAKQAAEMAESSIAAAANAATQAATQAAAQATPGATQAATRPPLKRPRR